MPQSSKKMKAKPKKIKTIGILTSGGDSPGMNCAIRAAVRCAIGNDLKVVGIKRGYSGLINNEMMEMNASSVGNIIQRGGTILRTSRCPEFKEKEMRNKAAQILEDRDVDALVVIGGDGSFQGALALAKESNLPVIGIPGTIDNDIAETEYTIGFNTAVQTAIEAVDKIRDTAEANDRTFLIEVMGARASSIATKVGICTGAENVLLNSQEVDYEKLSKDIRRGIRRGKRSSIIIVAEGEKPGRAYHIAQKLEGDYEIPSKVCILGHIQRGGAPESNDRFLSTIMGKKAIEALLHGQYRHGVVVQHNQVTTVPLERCAKKSDHVMAQYTGITESLAI